MQCTNQIVATRSHWLIYAQVPGSVPFLHGIEGFPHYDGNVMIPFSNDFSLFA